MPEEKITVFIADDDIEFCKYLTCILNAEPDMDVIGCAHDGVEVLRVLREDRAKPPDCVILDLVLPGLDGIAILERYFSAGRSGCKFIAVSPMPETPVLIDVINEAGASAYITKPIHAAHLVMNIRSLCREKSPGCTSLVSLINKEVRRELSRLGIPGHYKGYPYLVEAIVRVCLEPQLMDNMSKGVYLRVAEKFNTSVQRVERSVRHAIEMGCVRGNLEYMAEVFGYSLDARRGKPTNAAFISTLADRVCVKYGL